MNGASPRNCLKSNSSGWRHAEFDGLGVGALLRRSEPVEKVRARLSRLDPADVLDGAAGAVRALGELAREIIRPRQKVRKVHLPVGGFLAVGGRNAAPGGAARLLVQRVDAIVLPGQVEQPVRHVGNHGALVDQQALQDGIALFLERTGFPQEFSRVGDHAAADAKVGHVADHHAGGQEVQLDAAGGVPGVRAAVDLEDHGHRRAGGAQFVGNFRDQAALALVAEGNADVRDELAGEGEK